jgi:phosphoribosylformimino-5-aminoimidazole carboxamide ribotide isomerase
MQIIPAIDLIDGKCVRLTQGDYSQKTVYSARPQEVARAFEDAGVRRLHLVDLDGAKASRVVNLPVLEAIARETSLTIDFGGGIKRAEDLRDVFSAGASIATIGSIAVKEPETFHAWLDTYGGDKLLLGADVNGEHIAIHGWTEQTRISIFDFLQEHLAHGLSQAFCTDISRDGLLAGPSLELYRRIMKRFSSLAFIASGGVATLEDIRALEEAGCSGVIVGKALYENRITLEDLKPWLI